MGGGRRNFYPETLTDPEHPDQSGHRKDNRNLVEEWLEEKRSRRQRAEFVWNQRQFDNVDPDSTDYLLGRGGGRKEEEGRNVGRK